MCVLLVVSTVSQSTSAENEPRYVGSASCSAAACHGGLTGHRYVGAEFPIWSQRDPHSRAFSVLMNDESQRMAELLRLPKAAHESDVCLNCHSPAAATTGAHSPRLPPSGVDCEQCHGAAERWLEPHVRADWKTRFVADKRSLGYSDLSDLLTRANRCADCHVGAPGRDVNHDLIAAGHPRLFFELSTFHANWPRHWPEELDAKRHPIRATSSHSTNGSLLEAKLWSIGQVVTAQRSIELSKLRADTGRKQPDRWPEFAEWNCFACHHDLQSASWWQTRDTARRPRTSFGWNPWPYALLSSLAAETGQNALVSHDAPLARLQLQFTKPLLDLNSIARDAEAAAEALRTWAEQLNSAKSASELLAPAALHRLQQALSGETGRQLVARDWDSATQVVLAIRTLQHAIAAAQGVSFPQDNPRDREILALINAMYRELNFEPGLQSPRTFSEGSIARLQASLQKLNELGKSSPP
jgi:hypothetical protein